MVRGEADTLGPVLPVRTHVPLPPTAPQHLHQGLAEVDVEDEVENEVTRVVDGLQQVGHLEFKRGGFQI